MLFRQKKRTLTQPLSPMSLRQLGVVFFTATLAACSSEPSESDILESMQLALSQSGTELLGGYRNAPNIPTITTLDKIRCEYVDAAKHYACDVQLTLTTPSGERQEQGRVNLVEEGDGWVVVE